jgi:hypothetical protein
MAFDRVALGVEHFVVGWSRLLLARPLGRDRERQPR